MQTTDPSVRMLADGDPLRAPLERGLARVRDFVESSVGDRLHALVLTGSLARGEGATVDTGDGVRLLSDLDLYVLASSPEQLDGETLRRGLAEALTELGPVVVDLGLVSPDHFATLGSRLPARQMSFGARALLDTGRPWTRPESLAPDTAISVDPDDALRLLQNRMGEGLLRRAEADPGDLGRFHGWKMTWDAPLAYLAAAGDYHPDRPTQWDRLRDRVAGRDRAVEAWLAEGLARLDAMWAARAAGPISRAQLEGLAGDVRGWVWPFLRAAVEVANGGTDATRALVDAVRAGVPGPADLDAQLRWLRRRGLARTLREARRWAPEGPSTLTPWWRYGTTGTGPERILAAASLRWGRVDGWERIVAGLHRPPDADDAVDGWLGETWSEWITGGRRR